MMRIRACQPEEPTMPTIKITEDVRTARLKRPLKPSVTRDVDIPGLCLIVTRRRSFWALVYQPRGINPATGKRWGGGVRHELADAQLIGVADARGLALTAKGLVRGGRSPHHEAMASRTNVEAARAVLPTTVAEALDAYAKALAARTTPSTQTRAQYIYCARKACAFINAGALPITSINTRMARMLAETIPGSGSERVHVYGGLRRFLGWARRQGFIETNPCDALDRSERPKPGKSRSHVPSLETLRAVWRAVEDEPQHDLLRFLLLLPLRRNEASGLRWSEVDLGQGRVRLSASRTKKSATHELPLSPPARAILEARKATATGDLVFPSSKGTPYANWDALLARIRAKIGEGKVSRDDRFSLHDIRRAFVSHLAGQFDVDALDQCLGHRRAGVAGVYQRSARWPERIAALNAYAALITGVEPDCNVILLASARKVI
jgi:integrase